MVVESEAFRPISSINSDSVGNKKFSKNIICINREMNLRTFFGTGD